MVSESNESGIIQKRIVQNIYSSDVVICDVSCKNPNVMFELGMRLAFDKATIIIKDDATNYSFDTGPIEHLGYPRDLRFSKIVDFKNNLKLKLIATFEASKIPGYSTFLKTFGAFEIPKIQEKEVSTEKYLLTILESIQSEMQAIKRQNIKPNKKLAAYQDPEEQRNRLASNIFQYLDSKALHLLYEDVRAHLDPIKDELFNYFKQSKLATSQFSNEIELKRYINFKVDEYYDMF